MIENLSNYYDETNSSLFRDGYNYLNNKLSKGEGVITQPEYKFLCWLNYNQGEKYPITINKPHTPEIVETSIDIFCEMFCCNPHRKELFRKLDDFLKKKNNDDLNCEYLDVLIGGSYVDYSKAYPKDIDCAVLLEKEIHNYSYDKIFIQEEKELDINFLINDSSYKKYLNYIWITMMGNDAEIKDKENEHAVKNNTFRKRAVFKVRFNFSVLLKEKVDYFPV